MPGADFEVARQVRERLATYRLMRDLCWQALESGGAPNADALLTAARVACEASPEDLAKVPRAGAALIVASRPCGVFESLALAAVLQRVRSDVKVLTNYLVANMPGGRNPFIAADPWQTRQAVAANRRAMSEAAAWLQFDSLLAVFPAGDKILRAPIPEPHARSAWYRWSTMAPRLARSAGASVVPVWIEDSVLDGLAPGELPQPGAVIELRIGEAVPALRLSQFSDDRDAAAFLRWNTHLLGERGRQAHRAVPRLA